MKKILYLILLNYIKIRLNKMACSYISLDDG